MVIGNYHLPFTIYHSPYDTLIRGFCPQDTLRWKPAFYLPAFAESHGFDHPLSLRGFGGRGNAKKG
jgi:hypothetical protein